MDFVILNVDCCELVTLYDKEDGSCSQINSDNNNKLFYKNVFLLLVLY